MTPARRRPHLIGMETLRTATTKSPIMPAFALAECLDELAALLDRVADREYLARLAGGSADTGTDGGDAGTVGAHVRHCLDHVDAVLDRVAAGPAADALSYESPSQRMLLRRSLIEHSRLAAIAALRRAAERVRVMAPRTADMSLTIEVPLARQGVWAHVRSSLGRELVFVLEHTLHHQAAIARLLAQPVPVRAAGPVPIEDGVTKSWRAS